MSLMAGINAIAITIIATIGTSPAAIVEVTSEARIAMTNAMIDATRVMMQNTFTADSCTSAPSGPLIICGVMNRPAIPISAINAIDAALHERARRPRSQEETYSAMSSASGGIIAIM